jgi:hypothetical protein
MRLAFRGSFYTLVRLSAQVIKTSNRTSAIQHYWALKNSNMTEAREVRPDSDAHPTKAGLTLSERRFQEFDEFLFRDRPAVGEWADEAT